MRHKMSAVSQTFLLLTILLIVGEIAIDLGVNINVGIIPMALAIIFSIVALLADN